MPYRVKVPIARNPFERRSQETLAFALLVSDRLGRRVLLRSFHRVVEG
jgi:hypothetical protein